MKKVCGNCQTVQPFNATHVTCLCMAAKACGALKSVNSAGCKKWTPGKDANKD